MHRPIAIAAAVFSAVLVSCGSPGSNQGEVFDSDQISEFKALIEQVGVCQKVTAATPNNWTGDTVRIRVECANHQYSETYIITLWNNGATSVEKAPL